MAPHPLPLLTNPSPDAAGHPGHGLLDSHGRTIRDLRLSVTDRCNFRCTYCMEPDERFLPRRSLLSMEDYLRIIDTCIDLGVSKIRLTGGEPTLYPDLDALIAAIGERSLEDVAMTTNGWSLTPERAQAWRNTGLTRLTFSLDTLRENRMTSITRASTSVDTVLSSIETAQAAGFTRPKVNNVVQRGINDDEALAFAQLARARDLDVRFIEFMPLDSGRHWDRAAVVSAAETLARIEARFDLIPADPTHDAQTSVNYRFADGAPGRLGFIAPVSRPFCGACNRLRVTAEGMVRPCLFSQQEWDLRPVLSSEGDLASFLRDVTWTKQAGHGIGSDGFRQPERGMRAIGG